MESVTLGTFVALLCTWAVLSRAQGDSPVYRLAEHVLLGVAAGVLVVLEVRGVLVPFVLRALSWSDSVLPVWAAVVPALLTILLLARVWPRVAFVSWLPLAVLGGGLVGLAGRAFFVTLGVGQVGQAATGNDGAFSGTLLFGLCACVAVYVLMGRKAAGWSRLPSRLGAVVLMAGFGVTLGYFVIERVAVAVGALAPARQEPWPALVTLIVVGVGVGLSRLGTRR